MTRFHASLVLVALAAAFTALACEQPASSPSASPAGSGSASAPAVATKVTAFAISPENLNVDKVGMHEGYFKPDGARDLAFTVSIDGPVDALFLLSVNQQGEPVYGMRADTLLANEELPPELGGIIDTNKMTVSIGVVEAGQTHFANGDSGSLHLPNGVHNLTLYVPNTATLNEGAFVRVWVKTGNQLVPGPVTPY